MRGGMVQLGVIPAPKCPTSSPKRRHHTKSENRDSNTDSCISGSFIATSISIASFVPNTLANILIENLASQNFATLKPLSTSFTGICLVADISNFTHLSGVFCARGKDGLDDLQSSTSGYLGSLVDTIYSFGGDVVKFAGDALICVFKPVEDSLRSYQLSCAHALQCAWKLKEHSTTELYLHVAISCGEICVGLLGGFENRWECLISGYCLFQLAACLNDAPRKQVAVTPEFFECLSDDSHLIRVEAELQVSRNYLILSVEAAVNYPELNLRKELYSYFEDSMFLSQAACYVPRPVTQALMAGSFNFLAELREVTTVFIKFDGYDYDEHQDLMSLQKYFYACQDVLSDYGGFLRQFLIDDKGCVLIALWGVPTATFHDDCRRALGATVRIRSKLLDMKMPCSCGITSGVVYCGTLGNEVRREYAAVGDVVNLAARLMSKAHGEILLDQKTYSRLPEIILKKLIRRPLMEVKGKSELIETYQFNSVHTVLADGRLGASLVDDCIEEELPIRKICKDAFTASLQYLSSNCSVKNIQFLVLEGRLGTGREEAAVWLKRHCYKSNTRIVSIRLSKADAGIEHRAFAKIFRLLIREENFDDIIRQTFVVNTLLREMYPKDIETREKVAYPSMKCAFGVSCPLTSSATKAGVTQDRKEKEKEREKEREREKEKEEGKESERQSDRDREFQGCISSRTIQSRPSITSRLSITSSSEQHSSYYGERFDARIPRRHMSGILRDILASLIKEQPLVILIEESHDMDEHSWKLLLSLRNVQAKAFVVITQEPIAYLASVFSTAGSDSCIGELISPDSSILYDWIDPYMKQLSNCSHSSYILLPEFTFQEVRMYLADVLKVAPKDLPADLDQIVYNLSGGNPYWFQEIASFLQTYGVVEFFSSVGGRAAAAGTDSLTKAVSAPDNSYLGKFYQSQKSAVINGLRFRSSSEGLSQCNSGDTTEFNYSVRSKGQSSSIARVCSMSGTDSRTSSWLSSGSNNSIGSGIGSSVDVGGGLGYGSGKAEREREKEKEMASMKAGKLSHVGPVTSSSSSSSSASATAEGSSSKLLDLIGNSKSGSRLEFLVVCRFAKLSVDEQRVSRTASIIGWCFTSDVLNNVLSKQLRPYLPTILHSLVENHWLNMSSEQTPEGVKVEHSFSHPLLHKTLYDLTPSSVKIAIHLDIAQYIESTHFEDKDHFMSLGYHYSRSGASPSKAFKYLTCAAYEMLSSGHGSSEEAINLIRIASANVSSKSDAHALLGVVTCALRRVKSEQRCDDAERRTSNGTLPLNCCGAKKEIWCGNISDAANSPYSPSDPNGKRARLKILELSLEKKKFKYEGVGYERRGRESRDSLEAEGEGEGENAFTDMSMRHSRCDDSYSVNEYDSAKSENSNSHAGPDMGMFIDTDDENNDDDVQGDTGVQTGTCRRGLNKIKATGSMHKYVAPDKGDAMSYTAASSSEGRDVIRMSYNRDADCDDTSALAVQTERSARTGCSCDNVEGDGDPVPWRESLIAIRHAYKLRKAVKAIESKFMSKSRSVSSESLLSQGALYPTSSSATLNYLSFASRYSESDSDLDSDDDTDIDVRSGYKGRTRSKVQRPRGAVSATKVPSAVCLIN